MTDCLILVKSNPSPTTVVVSRQYTSPQAVNQTHCHTPLHVRGGFRKMKMNELGREKLERQMHKRNRTVEVQFTKNKS